MDQVKLAGEFGQVTALFGGAVTATDDHQRLVAKPRQGAVAHGAGRDTEILKLLLRLQPEVIGLRSRGDNEGVSLQCPPRRIFEHKWPALEINADDVLGDDAGAGEVHGLLAHRHHQLWAFDAVREAGEVFDLGGQVQLPQWESAGKSVFFGNGTFVNDWLEIGTACIDRAGPRRWSRSDDNDSFCHAD
jgi:hypothetical protein